MKFILFVLFLYFCVFMVKSEIKTDHSIKCSLRKFGGSHNQDSPCDKDGANERINEIRTDEDHRKGRHGTTSTVAYVRGRVVSTTPSPTQNITINNRNLFNVPKICKQGHRDDGHGNCEETYS